MSEEAVRDANRAFYNAFNERDIDAMDRLWARGAPVTCIHPGSNLLRGRETIMESWRAILANPAQPRVIGSVEDVQLRGDTAVVVGRELVSGSPLVVTNVYVRENDGWKLVHHHGSGVILAR